MSMKHLSLGLAIVALFLSACHEKPGNFNLQVNTTYGTQAFALNTVYTNPDGRKVKFEKWKVYIAHLTLVKNDNTEKEIKDVALLNWEDPSSLKINVKDVDGDYKGIKFYLGVDSLQNNSDPTTFSSSHPLSGDNGLYWTWLHSYIFESLDGKADTTTSGSPAFNLGLSYHVGGNSFYRQVVLYKSFSICCNNALTLNLDFDVKKIFYGATQQIDVVTERATASDDLPALAAKFADNCAQAFTLN